MSSILETKKALERAFFNIEGVSGVGLSFDEQTIIVYVESFTDELMEKIPDRAAGYPLKCVEIGRVSKDIVASSPTMATTPMINIGGMNFPDLPNFPLPPITDIPIIGTGDVRKQRWRPVIGGISAGHYMISTGTLGSVVTDLDTGSPLLLSNNHVFANSTSLNKPSATRGDPVFQPGLADGGGLLDNIGGLERWAMLDDSIRNRNLIDAALVRPDPGVTAINGVLGEDMTIIPINGTAPVNNFSVGQPIRVKKAGRTTGYTTGTIVDVNFSTVVDYGDGKIVRFVDQILADLPLDGGDSGSLMLDEQNRVVGLIFAGTSVNGRTYAVANKIRHVTTMLNIEFEGSEQNEEIPADTKSMSAPFVASALLGVGFGMVAMGMNYGVQYGVRKIRGR